MDSFKKSFKIALFNKKTFILLSLLQIAINLMGIGNALIFGELVNMVARGEPLERILAAVLFTAAYSLVWCALTWITYLFCERYAIRVRQAYRLKYLDALLNAKYNDVAVDDSATYINSINDDVDRSVNIAIFNGVDFFANIVSVVASFAAATFLRWEIALTMVGFTVVMAVLPFVIKKRLENSIVERSKRKGEYIGVLKENFLGLSIIKSYGGEKICADNIRVRDDVFRKSEEKMTNINVAAGQIPNIIRQFAMVVLIAATCYFVYIGRVEVGAVLSVFSIGQMFYSYILHSAAIVTNIFSTNGINKKLDKIYNLEILEKGGDMKFEDKIELKDVSFSYPTEDRKQVLKHLNLTLRRNGKYLVLGASGSGKSTVIKLLSKLYDDYEGEIFADGVDYRSLSEKDVSAVLSFAQQNGYLFQRTVRDNIDFLGTKDEARLESVIDLCMLRDFIKTLPDGLDTVLDEEVNQVSGGEKLRINLARALYKQGTLLLLDEVTSALDKTTSDKIERNILAIEDRTVVNVCHKFNDRTLKLYDEIVIIENGEIVLRGNFESLKDSPKLALYRNIRDAESEG